MHLRLIVAALALFVGLLGFSGSAKAQSANIVDTAAAAGSFTTLTKLLNETGLNEVLKGAGPFTVFAPTDEAFAKLPKDQLETLLKNKEALKRVLSYHVVMEKVSSAEVATLNGKVIGTAAGTTVRVIAKDGKVQINTANVVKTDIAASNGVIHVIDTVLVPPERKKK